MKINKNKTSKILIISLIALIISNVFIFFLITPGHGQSTDQKNILVISKGNDRDKMFLQSLQIDVGDFNVSVVSTGAPSISIGSWIDCIIIFDSILTNTTQNDISNYIKNGGSSIIIMGQELYNNASFLEKLTLLDNSLYETGKSLNTESMLFVINDATHPISKNIDWNSAPDINVANMSIIPDSSLNNTVKQIIDVYPVSKNLDIENNRKPILLEHQYGSGNIVLFTGWLEEGANLHFKLWPYFNYLLYTLIFESMQISFQSYPVWPYSPVPHLTEQIIIGVIILILAILAIVLYIITRRKSRAEMDQATIEVLERQAEEEQKKIMEEAKKLEKVIDQKVNPEDEWEAIGVHRQLGGFLFTLFLSLFLVLPQLLVSNFIMPQIIQPYPQAAGWYNYAYNFFQIVWILFDFGTSFALAKYFSEHRVKNPKKAIHYIQIYVWWQIFTGIIQITIIGFVGSIIFPYTPLAHMSWIFVVYSFIQYPGIFLVFMYTFQGLQRSDLHLISYVAWEVIWLLVGQLIFCYLGRMWGAANPIIGEALGAGIGYAVARCFDFWVTFIMTFIMFKKLGFSPKTCFRTDFTRDEFKESLRYGSRLAVGEGFVQIGWFLQVVITSTFVANYSNNLGWFNLAWTLGMIVQIVTLYGQSLLGAFSESSAHKKKTLTKLYVYQAFRWGNYFAYFLISVLFAVGAKFLVGAAGEDYGRPAVQFLVPLLIFHTGGIYSWLVDAVFEGTGRTGYAMLVWIIEQTTRALLMFLFVIIFRDMVSVILAYIPAVFTKDVIAWYIVRKKIIKYKLHTYKSFITPALSAIINFIVLYIFGEIVWNIPMGDKILNTAIIFLIGIFAFIYFYAFLDGFFGGYDDNTLKELERSADLVQTRFIRIFPKGMKKVAKFGARISPFHNKFRITMYEEAMKEAYDLTLEKKILKI